MGKYLRNNSRVCRTPPTLVKSGNWLQNHRSMIMSVSLITILSVSVLATQMVFPIVLAETPARFDLMIADLDQEGNLIRSVTYNTSFQSESVPFWGKITELTTGGFAIAGYHEADDADSDPDNRQLWVIRTDDDYNPVWNRTYGNTFEIRSITEMNNGDLAIGHYVDGYDEFGGIGQFQILVIDDEGEFIRERSWRFGWCSGFSHCDDGGFLIAKMILNTPDASPYWMARIDTDLSVIWNKTYLSFAVGTDIVEDMAGGFTMPLEPGLDGPIGIVRLDDQGDETSRVFTNSTAVRVYLSLTQCSNGEYLGWSGSYIIRFNIEGNILWERNVDFYVHGIKELGPDRFVAFERAGVRSMGSCYSGAYLECFDAGGITIWTRSVQAAGFFVPDIIYNTGGGLTILGMVNPSHVSSVLFALDTEKPSDFDLWLLDLDQDGSLVRDAIYDTGFSLGSVPFWGKITELTTGGFAIAGYHEIDSTDSDPDNHQLWVIRTDDDYNPVWNRTYGNTIEIRSITEMNNGDLAIGHYIKDYGYQESTFQILVIDDDGEFVRKRSWDFGPGWCSGFSHCDDGGFILAKEIYYTPASPFWVARIDTDLSVVWNKTYPSFATHTDILEDITGGFTMPLEPGLDGPIGIVRLDDQGNEVSRVFTSSSETGQYLTLTQCSNGEYIAGGPGYIIRFNIEGKILWEKNVDFYVHEIKELSPNRFVAFEAAGVRENGWGDPGVYLECFNASGTVIWKRSASTGGFFVPDIIVNADGGLTLLGMVDPDYLPFVLDRFSGTNTEQAYYLATSQSLDSWLYSGAKLSESPYCSE